MSTQPTRQWPHPAPLPGQRLSPAHRGVGQINGLLIPSLQRFIIPIPIRLDPPGSGEAFEVGLTQHHLYLVSATSRVFSAPAPAPPREH